MGVHTVRDDMAFFDATLDFAPVSIQGNDPILPEDRFVFELIGLERSEPDQWRKNGGIRWTWRVFQDDGRTPFVFQEEQYQFFRTTGIDAKGNPSMSVGTYAYEWASAMLGRELSLDERLNPSELRGARMSAMVVWEKQKTDPTRKTIKLASLRHVQKTGNSAPKPSPTQVSADPTDDEIDRATVVTELQRRASRLKKLDAEAGQNALDAVANSDLSTAPMDDLQSLSAAIQAQIMAALDA